MPTLELIIFIKSSFAAFFSTLFCIWLLHPVARHIGLVDSPGGRKWHAEEIPLIGGITMFFGFCFAMLILPFSLYEYRGLLAGCGLLIMIGVVDDFRELGSKLRLLGQLIACFFLIVWGQKYVTTLGNLLQLGDIHLKTLEFPLTVIAVVGFINAMNMVDGQDGLAGGIALTQIIPLIILSVTLNNYNDTIILGVVAVLISAFLAFNMPLPWRPYAKIFLGDAGSTFIAFIIAWFAIDISQTNTNLVKPITVLWILALPLFDLINVCLYRINKRISPLTAGSDHLHHLLHKTGINKVLSTLSLCLLSLTFGTLGLMLAYFETPESISFLIYMTALASYLLTIRLVRDGHDQQVYIDEHSIAESIAEKA